MIRPYGSSRDNMRIVLLAIDQHRDHRERRQNAQRDAEPRPGRMVPLFSQEPVEQRPSEIDQDDGHKNHDF